MTEPSIAKGLAGVVVDTTAVSKVNPETNSLLYRGYPVQELAAHCTFEDVAHLLWHGELPTAEERERVDAVERAHRALPTEVRTAVDLLPITAHPMDVARTAVSVLGALDPLASDDSREAVLRKGAALLAVFPSVVAYDQRRRRGQELVEPREDLGYAANFLWMTFGTEAPAEVVRAFDISMTLYAEHSFNASTFTARVITSTLSDLHSAITGAIGALKGPLHGGANEAVMHAFEDIGIRPGESAEDAAARARTWLAESLAAKRKIMGFGHRVYKNGDSRVPTMKAAMESMVTYYGRDEILGLYAGLETAMEDAKGIKPNLDYPAGPTYHLMGFDTAMFTPLFIAARISGWTAHVLEQAASNSLIRPLSAYDGPDERHVGVPGGA